MTDRDNLPAKTTLGHLILPKEHPGSLVARGLEAIANRQKQQPLMTVERGAESLTLDAFEAFVTHKDFAKALELASKAAEQGHAHAYYVLGFIYSFGGDNERDYVLAHMWDTLALKYLLGANYSKHRDDAIKHLDWLSRRMTPAQISMAEQLAQQKAAELGDAEAQFHLGEAYHDGDGVSQDDVQAVKWWRKAAEQGGAAAQHQLGCAYRNGEGVPKDYVKAHMWLSLAWDSTSKVGPKIFYNPSSNEIREDIAQFMTSAEIAVAQRLAREWVENHASLLVTTAPTAAEAEAADAVDIRRADALADVQVAALCRGPLRLSAGITSQPAALASSSSADITGVK